MSSVETDPKKSRLLGNLKRTGLALLVLGFFAFVFLDFGHLAAVPSFPNHYANLAFPILYLFFLGSIIWQTRNCYRLVPTHAQKQKLLGVMVWLFLLSFAAFIRFSEAFQADAPLSADFLGYFGPLLAIQALLELIKMLLTPPAPKAPTGDPEKINPDEWLIAQSETLKG